MDTQRTISRRTVLASMGLASVSLALRPLGGRALAAVGVSTTDTAGALQLRMRPCLVEMIDESRVPMWAFDSPQTGPRVPGPVIQAVEGRQVQLEITNELTREHAFAIPGVLDPVTVDAGGSTTVSFTAPRAGTYVYLDPLRAPVHRAMGLAGAFIVLPEDPLLPYGEPTTPVRNLFDDLGTTDAFPGDRWRPERSWLWVFMTVDPVLASAVSLDPDLLPQDFVADYLPRYFTINGRSGYFAAKDPATAMHGRVGQPSLLRTVNVGLFHHSPHIHGNHVFVLARDRALSTNMPAIDTWSLPPLGTVDVLHPFVRPPDAHPWPPSDPSVWTTDLAGDGTRGMAYPVHCHTELAVLANGANYPQGAVTHWVLEGASYDPPDEDPDDEDPEDEDPEDDDPDDDPDQQPDDPPDDEDPDDPPDDEDPEDEDPDDPHTDDPPDDVPLPPGRGRGRRPPRGRASSPAPRARRTKRDRGEPTFTWRHLWRLLTR